MSSYKLPPHVIDKFEQVIEYEIQVIGTLAEIANDIGDPALRTIITSVIGDENGHIRLFELLMLLTSNATYSINNNL